MNDTADAVAGLRAALAAAGLAYEGALLADGRLHRFKAAGDHDANSWYVLYADGQFPAGSFGCWKRQLKQTWAARNGEALSPADRAYLRNKAEAADKLRRASETELQAVAQSACQAQFHQYPPADSAHPYLAAKGVGVHGPLRQASDGSLFIPLADENGVLWSRETVQPNGEKRYLTHGRVKGCFHTLSNRLDSPLLIAEGYATAASCHEATNWATVAAMNAGNLKPVASALRKLHPDRLIVFAADDDRFLFKPDGKPNNVGLESAREAAKTVGQPVAVVFPSFAETDSTSKDFNDLHQTAGIQTVAAQILAACQNPYSFLSFDELAVLPQDDNALYIGNHILQRGEPLTLIAPPEAGKSKLLLQMIAACCARHQNFLHLNIHPAAHSLRWLVIQSENSLNRLRDERNRLHAWITAADQANGQNAWQTFNQQCRILVRKNDSDSFLALTEAGNLKRLQRSIELLAPDVICFDPLYEFTTKDLNKDVDMREVCLLIRRLASHRNPARAIVVLHHALPGSSGAVKATGYEAGTFGRNSKVLLAWTRAQINLAKDPADDSSLIALTCGKCSDGNKFPPAAIQLNPSTLIYELVPDADTLELAKRLQNPQARQIVFPPDQVRSLCQVTGTTKTQLARLIIDDCGCSKRAAFNYIARAIKAATINFNQSEKLCFRN